MYVDVNDLATWELEVNSEGANKTNRSQKGEGETGARDNRQEPSLTA